MYSTVFSKMIWASVYYIKQMLIGFYYMLVILQSTGKSTESISHLNWPRATDIAGWK